MNGPEMIKLIEVLFPILRSLTGEGVRETLAILSRQIPIEIHEVPSGSPALDWTVPREWNIREAWIRDPSGETIVDLRDSNLHVVGYSIPIRQKMSLAELDAQLHSIPEQPEWIPWRTSFYEENWGFCLPHSQREKLAEGEYEVCIDSTLEDGSLTYAELFLPGESDEELLISVHICHPSLVNDNLSGIAVATAVAEKLAAIPHRLGVRFVFAPGTIGSITWLERNRAITSRIVGGLTLTCLGDDAPLTYKRTFHGKSEIDRVASQVLSSLVEDHGEIDFYPYGYDERQYNSPGFRMPIGSLMRSRHGRFPEYHTSADNISLVSADQLEEAATVVAEILDTLDRNRRFRSLAPEGEPQLGRRGIYRAIGGGGDPETRQYAMLWLLQTGDGEHTLLDVVDRSGISFDDIHGAAIVLEENALIEWC
jgi:aminopeptidase-like protein